MNQNMNQKMGDGQNVKKGEYYDRISEIITQDEAWDRILSSDEFEKEYEEMVGIIGNSAEHIRSGVEDLWRCEGISFYGGFFVRSDGQVEVRADA